MTRQDDQAIYSIGAVARMLEIPTSTLRAWEERYSVITPLRSEGSQRLYSRAQVEQLRFIKSRLESGASAADAHRLLSQEMAADRIPAGEVEAVDQNKPLVLLAERDSYAAGLADILTEENNAAVAFHLLCDAARNGVTICQFRHAQPPSA